MNRLQRRLIGCVVVAGACWAGMGASAEAGPKLFATDDGVAIAGYDLVAYFTTNTAMEGKPGTTARYAGLTFRFSTEENRDLFQKDPKAYLPQYGGWCAYGMGAKDTQYPADPKTFKIVEGKLYLFYNGEHGNTSVPWNADERALRQQADAHWKQRGG
ncbi:MAG: YHS domain protein [Deltaproteobacteria bacterium]|nr:YHS domain protein [Deltaproteobacteria bacterium]